MKIEHEEKAEKYKVLWRVREKCSKCRLSCYEWVVESLLRTCQGENINYEVYAWVISKVLLNSLFMKFSSKFSSKSHMMYDF